MKKPNSRKPKSPTKKSPEINPRDKTRLDRSIFGRAWTFFLAFCTLVGILTLWPRVTVEAEGQIDPSNPHPISFKITNVGFIPLRNLQPMIGLCEFDIGEPHNLDHECEGALGTKLSKPQWFVKELERDEPWKIRFDDLFSVVPPAKFGAADISVIVEFNPWFIPLRWPIEYRFQTRLEQDGKLSWMPRPLNK